jgi:hypothetical protein
MLTTNAFFGSGYETMLFNKSPKVNEKDKSVSLVVKRHFHQKDENPSTVHSWEPHVVFIPQSLSATILIWTPDKKRTTDSLRQNPMLKSAKKPLRWAIHKFGLTETFGIANERTYQFYPKPDLSGFQAIEESIYFAPTKAEKGPEVDSYSAQMIFAFLQRAGLFDEQFFKSVRNGYSIPEYYHPWIDKIFSGEQLEDVFHRTIINIPQKTYFREDILKAQNVPG